MALTQAQLEQSGAMLVTTPMGGSYIGLTYLYIPGNNAAGFPPSVYTITDPQNLAGLPTVDISTLPKTQTGNVQQDFFYGKHFSSVLDSTGVGNLVNQYNTQVQQAKDYDAKLAASNAKLGNNAYGQTGPTTDQSVYSAPVASQNLTDEQIAAKNAGADANNPGTGSAPSAGPGLAFDPSQALADIYAQRPDLQEVYGFDGRAKNPNDPRVANIPTILDWARQYGINEYPAIKDYFSSNDGGTPGGTTGGLPGTPGSGGTGGIPNGGQTASTGNPQVDAILGQIQKFLDTQLANGQIINPNIEISPEMVKQFLDQATAEISPYYQNQIKAIKTDLTRSLDDLQKSYDLNKQQSEASFKQSLGNTRENLAGAGLAFSGVRGAQEQQLADAATLQQKEAGLQAAKAAQSAIGSAEKVIGSSNLPGSYASLSEYGATSTGEGSFTPSRTLDFAPSGGVTGSLEYSQRGDIRTLQDYLTGQEVQKRTLAFGG